MNLIRKCRYGLMIYNDKDIWVGRSLNVYGEFSESEVQVFTDCIKPGMTVIDIGANIGCHTIAFGRLVGPSGVVYAYEPERLNFNTLAGNIALNNFSNIYAYQKAVGAADGFIRVPELDQQLTVNFGGLTLDADYRQAPGYSVPLITLDSVGLEACDFIKIDIEGMEKEALWGAQETIKKFKPTLYVENDRMEKSEELIQFIDSLGYVMHKHDSPLFNQNNFYDVKDNIFRIARPDGTESFYVSANLLCHHKDKPCPIDTAKFNMAKI